MRAVTGFVVSVLAVVILGGSGSGVASGPPGGQRGDLYYAGDSVEGLPLTSVLRRSDTAEYVSFVYGDCVPADDLGCAPPVEIQVWPACRRHLGLYGALSAHDLERLTVRGVPGALLDGGTRLELQSGRSTIVVFADSRQRLSRIAADLRSLSAGAASGVPLPPPAPGAVEGRLAC
jgi:hypothetical protein